MRVADGKTPIGPGGTMKKQRRDSVKKGTTQTQEKVAPTGGIEPSTTGLKVQRSTAELNGRYLHTSEERSISQHIHTYTHTKTLHHIQHLSK